MADRYVIAAGGNSNTTATWSDTSGGAGGFSIPTATDNVFLDAASGPLVINGTLTVGNFDCTGYTSTLSGNSALNVTGDTFKLVAGMTFTFAFSLTFTGANAAGDVTITTAGKSLLFASTLANGVGKVFKLADALTSTSALQVTNGEFNSQGFNITTSGAFNANNTNVKTLTLTGSDIVAASSIIDATNTTWSPPDSLTLLVNASTTTAIFNGGVTLPLLNIDLSAGSTARYGGLLSNLGGSLIINELAFIGPPDSTLASCVLQPSANIRIDKAHFPEGVQLCSAVNGTQRTITTNTDEISFDGCMIRDIVISGGPAYATNSIDLGNNSGITFQNFGANTHEITGVTYDDAGAILGSCICTVTKEVGGVPVVVGTAVSDAVTGVYIIGTPDNDAAAYTVTWTKLGSPRGDAMIGITPTAL